jgi:glycerate-2-kinase
MQASCESHDTHWAGFVNQRELCNHGPVRLREDGLAILERAIRAADPYPVTKALLRLEGKSLAIGNEAYDLRRYGKVWFLGAGKASQAIAVAVEEVLGENLYDGLVVVKRGQPRRVRRIRFHEAAHPIPDEASLAAGQALMSMAASCGPRDLVIAAVTGGSSALAVLPAEGITFSEKQALHRLLVESGATIREINAVRKHTSRIKGGLLAEAIFPAEIINLTVSDVTGDPLDYITDLTVPDTSTYEDAWATLDSYDLWDRVPASVRTHLRRGMEIETPKVLRGRYRTWLVVPGDAARNRAAAAARDLGYEVHVLPSEIEGPSRQTGAEFVRLIDGSAPSKGGGRPGTVIVASGETAVRMGEGARGNGGPNQEFAVSAALAIRGSSDLVVAAVDTDGTDGPTPVCGGMVDGDTVARAESMGIDVTALIDRHASMEVLQAAGDLIISGHTGTNVNSLMMMLVLNRSQG